MAYFYKGPESSPGLRFLFCRKRTKARVKGTAGLAETQTLPGVQGGLLCRHVLSMLYVFTSPVLGSAVSLVCVSVTLFDIGSYRCDQVKMNSSGCLDPTWLDPCKRKPCTRPYRENACAADMWIRGSTAMGTDTSGRQPCEDCH